MDFFPWPFFINFCRSLVNYSCLFFTGITKKRKKQPKSTSTLDLGPKEFSDESSDESEKQKNNVKTEAKPEKTENDEKESVLDEEYEVEKVLDYKWCLATVSLPSCYLIPRHEDKRVEKPEKL